MRTNIFKKIATGALAILLCLPRPVFAASPVTVEIPVTVEGEACEVQLARDGQASPALLGAEKAFAFSVSEPGTYECEIKQVIPEGADHFDKTIYTVQVFVEDDGTGALIYTLVINKNDAEEKTGEVRFENKKEPTKVRISKKDMTTGEEIEGAVLEIRNEQGDLVTSWISGPEPHYIENLAPGNYTLTETFAPAGYVTAETVTFTVEDTGEIQEAEMLDDVTKVTISKKDMTTGEELPGATLIIKDAAGQEVERWVSTDEPHYIEKLPVGKYTLTEVSAPDGYVTAETVLFTVEDTGEIQAVEMKDDITKVKISKVELAGGKELPGATLTVKDKDGNVIEEWVSTDEPHYIEKLPVGTYTLTETTTPNGYVTAETITFEVADTGEIQTVTMKDDITKMQISKKDMASGEELPGATLIVKNAQGETVEEWTSGSTPHYMEKLPVGDYTLTELTAPDGFLLAETVPFTVKDTGEIQGAEMKDAPTRIQISKRDMANGEELPGATLVIADENGQEIIRWVSTDKPFYIEKLPVGDYTLTEITAPAGYAVAETILFTVDATGEIQTVEMLDAPTRVQISKKDITNGKELPGAKLVVKDKNGKVIEQWTSTDKPHMIERLPEGEYTLTEITAPKGYEVAETVRFTVKATGEIQTVEMFDRPKTTAVEKPKETPKTPTKTEDKMEPQTPTSAKTPIPAKSVKTGDASAQGAFLLLFIGSLGTLLLATKKQKKTR